MKLGLLVIPACVYAIERQQVEVNVEIERVTEMLNKCDGAALRISESQEFSSALAQVPQYRSCLAHECGLNAVNNYDKTIQRPDCFWFRHKSYFRVFASS